MVNVDKLLDDFKSGSISKENLLNELSKKPIIDLGFAQIDRYRAMRKGFPEVIYCKSKTPEQVYKIFMEMKKENNIVLGTKASSKHFDLLRGEAEYDPISGLLWYQTETKPRIGRVVIASAGTSDEPVAEEAAKTADLMGANVARRYDIGVAGLHRLGSALDDFQRCNAIVVVAGMEGALGTIISGLTSKPVIAVPTSVGYGVNFEGITPLLTMLSSCSPGVSVVNIDNGFGAGYIAAMINRQSK